MRGACSTVGCRFEQARAVETGGRDERCIIPENEKAEESMVGRSSSSVSLAHNSVNQSERSERRRRRR